MAAVKMTAEVRIFVIVCDEMRWRKRKVRSPQSYLINASASAGAYRPGVPRSER